MTTIQRLPPSLTPLDAMLAMLLEGLAPIAPVDLRLGDALGCVVAEIPPLAPFPASNIAAVDGFALRAADLVGASSYSPLPLRQPPVWVEVGDAMPVDCDCVIDADLVEWSGPLAQVVAEATPGQGIRRAGEDIAGRSVIAAGRPFHALDLLATGAAGLQTLPVRRPRVHLVNVPNTGSDLTANCIAELAVATGTAVARTDAVARDAASVAQTLRAETCDLVILIGGTGVGRADAAVEALAARGRVLAHGVALVPGRTIAIGDLAGIPVIALPGAPAPALAGWWTLALPVLDRLSARQPRATMTLPLARKIASHVGLCEIAMLKQIDGAWTPLASGDLSLDAIVRADAWLAVPADSEGFAAGTSVDGYIIRDRD